VSRLLIVSRSHNPLGGADRIIADLCRELPSRGWDTVLGLTRGARFDDPDAYRQVHQDLPTVDVDGTMGTRACRLKALHATIRKVAPDVLLSMRVFDAYEAVAKLKAAAPKTTPRLMVGVRAFESPYISDVRRCRSNIDFCVTSGNLIAAACCSIGGLPQSRVESIGGGIHPPRRTPVPYVPGSPFRLLYAGRLEQSQKRALDLVPFVNSLVAQGVDFRLEVCGAGPEEDQLRRELAEFIRAGRVVLCGWVDQEALYTKHYPNSDCFVHFAAWEGITISPREAMAHGVIPVISEFTGLKAEGQFLNEVNSLTFPVGRPDLAAQQVARLSADAGLRQSLSAAARVSQTGRYSFQGSIDAWRDGLDRCLELPPQSGPFPKIPEELGGRLTDLGVPSSLQLWIRNLIGKPVLHSEPGSEWPTASGLITLDERREIEAFGNRFES
jgi:glycosyltransferase involved in cell wall biosynthesis